MLHFIFDVTRHSAGEQLNKYFMCADEQQTACTQYFLELE